MTRGEAIDALEALTEWARMLAARDMSESSDERGAIVRAFPLEAAARCGHALVSAGVIAVVVIDENGVVLPIERSSTTWSGLTLFAAIAKGADALGCTRGELVRRVIDHAARVALADALNGVEATPKIATR